MREMFAAEIAQDEKLVAERIGDHGAARLGAVGASIGAPRDPGDLTPSDVRRGMPALGEVTRETSARTVLLEDGDSPRPSRAKWIAIAGASLAALALAFTLGPTLRGSSAAEPAPAATVIEAPAVEPEPAHEEPSPAVVLPIPAEPALPQPIVGATRDGEIIVESTEDAKSSDNAGKPRPARKTKPREDKKPGKKPKWDPDSPLPPM
jgi:hypothetical protein